MKFITAVLLLISTQAVSNDLPIATANDACDGYSSIEKAAVAGLNHAASMSREFEYGGVIYQVEAAKYCYTLPVTNNDRSHVKYAVRLRQPIVAMYHTHPTGDSQHRFSAPDVKMVQAMQIPSYVAALELGEVRVLAPRKIRTAKPSDRARGSADGVIVAAMDR